MNMDHRFTVLLISIFFPPERGGGATGAWNRAMLFSKLGYSVFVITTFPAYPSGKVTDTKYNRKFFHIETIDSIVVLRLRLLPVRYAGYLRRLVIFVNFVVVCIIYMPKILSIIGKENIVIVYSRSPVIFSSFIGLVYSKSTKSFFIYEAPDLWPEEFVVYRTRLLPIIQSVGKLLAKVSFSLPNIVITVSELAASYISDHYRPKATVYGLPVGVDPSKFHKLPKRESRAQLINSKIIPSLAESKFIVMYSGIISSIYRLEDLVFLADRLRNEKDIIVLIIGEGSEKQRLYTLKEKLKLDNLFILPSQSRELMPSIISSADICTILLSSESIYNIVLPIRFYEYLACCKPIVSFSDGELANIIHDNNIGYTVKVGDIDKLASIIKNLKNSSSSIQSIEKNCSNTLQKFSLDKISSDLLKILEKEAGKVIFPNQNGM